MQAADLIQKILDERGWTQTALSEITGVDRTLINNYLNGKREPGPLTCVFLAALASAKDEKLFWIAASRLTARQIDLLAQALGEPAPAVQAGEEAQLINWWRDPKDAVEKSLKDFVEQMLKVRTIKA